MLLYSIGTIQVQYTETVNFLSLSEDYLLYGKYNTIVKLAQLHIPSAGKILVPEWVERLWIISAKACLKRVFELRKKGKAYFIPFLYMFSAPWEAKGKLYIVEEKVFKLMQSIPCHERELFLACDWSS